MGHHGKTIAATELFAQVSSACCVILLPVISSTVLHSPRCQVGLPPHLTGLYFRGRILRAILTGQTLGIVGVSL
ncbi:hypothetical protein VFPPC_16936 [Pochonia chlamydosporia 170]|uniref:Uncharacterized protein n=1 Tax=Pochonia chlamydosporia 170 TaxID=1380566 RepID=A0A179F0D1_METCM|nr:hypothetical protein VFPPC_16936 [Pochonia chlamydosporia 170]OAQ58904.1 hypothetical protein VFPPC_16936 [Pochonia chlamydosporia 170]